MNFYLINKTRWKVPKKLLTWLVDEIVSRLEKKHSALKGKELGLIFVGTKAMTATNSQFRHKDRVTDILSFAGEGDLLGELLICADVVKRQAREHELHEYEELSYLVLHGILHLLGYDHETNARDAKKMMALQDRIFEQLREASIPGVKHGKPQFRKKSRHRIPRRQKSNQ